MNTDLVKIVVAGDGNVGKTSLIRRYTQGKFESSRVATIGVDFHTQTVELSGQQIRLSIWDMAGQERFKVMRPGFYRGSRAAALVYDVTEPESLANLRNWCTEIQNVIPKQRFIVVANKIDLDKNHDTSLARRFAASIQAPYLKTSALTEEGVEEMFLQMARLAIEDAIP
jgi:Ras-related protein Rab-1B